MRLRDTNWVFLSFPTRTLPTLGSANSVNSEAIGGVVKIRQDTQADHWGWTPEPTRPQPGLMCPRKEWSMDVKERRPYCSLTKNRREKERRYTNSSADNEECRVPTQKSYSSSETLKAFDHDSSRLLYGNRVKDLVHREADEFSRQGQNFTLRQLGVCEPATRRGLAFCAEMGLPHRGYSISAGSDADTENEAVMSPEHAMRLWGRGVKSGRSSCLSSRSNSALTLTDTEHENKSDSETGKVLFVWGFIMLAAGASVCFGWLWRNGFLPSPLSFSFFLLPFFALQHSSTQKMSFSIALFFLGEKKVNIQHQSVKLCYASILCCVSYSFEKQSNHVQKKKKVGFDLSWTMSPVILHGVAEQVVIKFTPEPACNQRCLCRFLLKISQRSSRISEWMSEHTEWFINRAQVIEEQIWSCF